MAKAETPGEGRRAAGRWRLPATVLGLAVLGTLAIAFGDRAGGVVVALGRGVEDLGPWGAPAFALGYAVAVVAFVPGSLLTLACGALFGLGRGTAVALLGATLGASTAFFLARTVARTAVERWLEGNERFARIDRAVGAEGLKIVTLMRLSPAFPFNLLNYGLGLTRVRFLHFLVACLGMLPGTFLYVAYGKAVGDLAALAAGERPDRGPGDWIVLALGLAATVAVTWIVTRTASRALQEKTEVRDEVRDD